jgi:hypothetical protein
MQAAGLLRIARHAGARVVEAGPRRTDERVHRARAADVLVFVHADTLMPPGWRAGIEEALAHGRRWGDSTCAWTRLRRFFA